MFGLLLAAVWLLVFLALAFRFGSGTEKIGTVKSEIRLDATARLSGMADRFRLRSPSLFLVGIGLTPFWFVFGNNCSATVPPAHVAVLYDPLRGGIQKEVLPEGFHFVMPWWQTHVLTQQTQEYTMSGNRQGVSEGAGERGGVVGDESIRCQTNEGMNVQVDCTVLFHVDPKDADDLWKKIGEDYLLLIVRPYAQNVLRMVVARYSVEDVYSTKRKQIEQEVTDGMKTLYAEKGLVLEQVLMRNVTYGNPAFAEAITAKQVAQQEVQTENAKLSRAKIQKQTVIAEAQGEAQAISKRGATLRDNPEVVQYEFVQKIAPRLRSMYLPAGALPVLGGGGR